MDEYTTTSEWAIDRVEQSFSHQGACRSHQMICGDVLAGGGPLYVGCQPHKRISNVQKPTTST